MASSVRSADGVDVQYEVAGAGEPTLVFVHGWGLDRHLWDGTRPSVVDRHRVVALDLGGHGRSGRGRREWTMEAFGQDVVAVFEAVAPPRAVLIGHSMGGPVALEAALRLGARVTAIVLVDSMVDVSQRMAADEIEGLLTLAAQDYPTALIAMVKQFLFHPTSDPQLADRVASAIGNGPPEIVLNALRHSWRYDAAAGFATTRAPIRAINADLYPTNVEANRQYAPDYDAMIMTGGLSHYPMLEDQARFNARLAETLVALGIPR